MDQKKLRIWTLFTQWLIQKKLESPLNSLRALWMPPKRTDNRAEASP